ncbi:hypothetical protein H0H87_005028 [Tephrocybe sp. NHM501043]|nr:hypothetical protein H0H87_005028 [Tephrocybe sp. NHM501043]
MVSDLYVFDMDTFNWEKIPISNDDDVPRARYFHSADTWNNKLIIFGGMSNQPESPNPEELCVLNDVRFFDISTRRWLPAPQGSPAISADLPRARYAHLSSVTSDRLFIIGGQDFNNTWLDDVCVYDLVARSWVLRRDYPRHCGTYRSVAVASNSVVRFPMDETRTKQEAATLGPPGQRLGADRTPTANAEFTPSESLIHQPYSASPNGEYPSDIFLYSNYNFTDVKRELEVFSPLPSHDFSIQDKSTSMAGATFPPGLRFPTGALLGTHLIIAGTYLAHSYQSFSIWVLDLTTMAWTRIDPGKAVETGSWFRGSLYADANRFVIFGNRNGNLVDDYNRRLLSWDHVAVVDLEAFGVYGPPRLKLDLPMQELGLAALEERTAADFDMICEDGRRIPCSRRILEERWPWFLEQRKLFTAKVNHALTQLPTSPAHLPLPDVPGNASSEDLRVDPRLTSRALELAEPYPIVLALMQYFYTTALVTPLQHAPAVLSQLLLLSTNYGLTHLQGLIRHAMHRALSNSTSVGVYEVATLCSCRSLQIRSVPSLFFQSSSRVYLMLYFQFINSALKTVMQYTQKRPSRNRDRDNNSNNKPGSSGGGGGGPSNGPGGGGGGSGSNDAQHLSRPRGTSDARWRTMGSGGGSDVNSGYNTRAVGIVVNNANIVESQNTRGGRGGVLSPSLRPSTSSGPGPTPVSPLAPGATVGAPPPIARWRSDPALNNMRRNTLPGLAHAPVVSAAPRPSTGDPKTTPRLTVVSEPKGTSSSSTSSDAKNADTADLNYLADLMGVPSTEELQTLVETRARSSSLSSNSIVSFDSPTSEDAASPVYAIAGEGDKSREDQNTPVPFFSIGEEERQRDVDTPTPVPTLSPAQAAAYADEDQIMPLPNLRPRKSQRRPRAASIVSIHTEEEMQELVDFMSDFTTSDIGGSIAKPSMNMIEREDVQTGELSPSIITSSPDLAYLSRSNRASFSPSVAPSLSASVLTVTDSEHSDSVSDKHDSIASAYARSRPPRIFTDSMQSIPPSLISSTSNSSLSNGRFTSPSTPLTSTTDLMSSPADLGIIDEHYTYNNDGAIDSDNPDPFSPQHMSFFAQDHPVKKWPQQRSNINWTPSPQPPHIDIPRSHSTQSLTSLDTSASTIVAEPMSPRTPGGSTFGRLLGRKKDDTHGLTMKEKEKEKKKREQEKVKTREKEKLEQDKKLKEKKPKETPEERKARLETLRKERLKKALMAEPSMMGGMMALA